MNLIERTIIRLLNGRLNVSGQEDGDVLQYDSSAGEWVDSGGLVHTVEHDQSSTLATESAGTWTTLIEDSIEVASGEAVLIMATCNFSHSVQDQLCGFRFLHQNTTNILGHYWVASPRSATDGLGGLFSAAYIHTSPGTGSIDYDLQVVRNSSGTGYFDLRNFELMTVKTS